MKKSKKNLNILPIIVIIPIIIFIGYLGYAKLFTDNTAPVITLESDTLTVSVHDSEEALLTGVTAEDNKDGDLTSSVVVEKKTPLEDGKRKVTYAVIDRKGNIGRAERTVIYTEHEMPTFNLLASVRLPINEVDYDLLDFIEAESSVDGDLTKDITCQIGYGFDYTVTGLHEIEYSVTDSTGTTAYLPVIAEFFDPKKELYTITLTDYLVYVEKGESFDPMAYYEGSDAGSAPEIESDVNTDQPGVYHVTYTVGSEDAAGVSRLVVVVTE